MANFAENRACCSFSSHSFLFFPVLVSFCASSLCFSLPTLRPLPVVLASQIRRPVPGTLRKRGQLLVSGASASDSLEKGGRLQFRSFSRRLFSFLSFQKPPS